jgi:hypothetical protein
MFLIAVAQLFLAIASFTEGRFGADARAHFESAGTSAHHAHNEADCAACAARGLLAMANRADHSAIESQREVALTSPKRDEHPDRLTRSSSRPRAPPLRQA